jgi:tetratricopeptide (TPR) repeat protein
MEYLSIFAQIFEMAKNRKNQEDNNQGIGTGNLEKETRDFLERYQTIIIGVVAAILLAIAAYLAYSFLYQKPREKTASEQMWKAEEQFQRDSFALALESPGGGYYGFLDIAENYSGTKAANLAKYYAGLSYLNLNRFDDAITYLSAFNPKTELTRQTTFGALGDAYAEKGDFSSALKYYKDASNLKNDFLTPYYLNKLGLLNQKQGNNDAALAAFKKIAENYPTSQEGGDVAKYIALLEK